MMSEKKEVKIRELCKITFNSLWKNLVDEDVDTDNLVDILHKHRSMLIDELINDMEKKVK